MSKHEIYNLKIKMIDSFIIKININIIYSLHLIEIAINSQKQSKDLSKRVTSKKVNLQTYGKVIYVYKLLFYSFT